MEQVEYPPMSGTNTICVATVLIETGMVPSKEGINTLTLEAPAGLVEVEAEVVGGQVVRVTFRNVPAFAVHLERRIEVPTLGTVTVDVAYGGMIYVIADAAPFGLALTPDEGRDIVRIGEMIKAAAREQLPVAHPENPKINGITIAQLSAPPTHPEAHRKNAVVVSTGILDWDRPSSWTGAPTARHDGNARKDGRMHARGALLERTRSRRILARLTGRPSANRETYAAAVPKLPAAP
jgi:proline racemase